MRPVHGPGDGKTLTFAERGIEGETAMIDVGQQVRKITLDRGQPLVLAKRIDQQRIRVVQRGQRRRRLGIQRGVVRTKTANDGWRGTHRSLPE